MANEQAQTTLDRMLEERIRTQWVEETQRQLRLLAEKWGIKRDDR